MGDRRGCCGSAGSHARGAIPPEADEVVEKVRERYGQIAGGSTRGCGCGTESSVAVSLGYKPDEIARIPEGANLGLGCGAPVEHLDLASGETVLDLGSGAGMDAFLAARVVGRSGRVIGVDMTPEMIEKARANAANGGFVQVEFLQGRLEALPVADASVDAVTSNCVINLVPDKAAVFREVARVLRPGGRMAVSDIVLDGRLPDVLERDLMAYVGCVAGAMQRDAYFALVEEAGLAGIEVLRDVDYLEAAGDSFTDNLKHAMDRAGIRREDLRGKVRSVTFRAVKPVECPPPAHTVRENIGLSDGFVRR